ncbi:unnamed protein product [Protopolystoma xenopodis]|uniref:Uncharacterized protein n=1 Tax=Protopolystoma xenopodis TaxID=117903 RepID=A0A3S5BZ02_9PLAT|nr:unnamed protein product [Protopolystoma xenopodis]
MQIWKGLLSSHTAHQDSHVRRGHFFAINRTSDLSATVGRFYELFTTQPADGFGSSGVLDSDNNIRLRTIDKKLARDQVTFDVPTESESSQPILERATTVNGKTSDSNALYYSLPFPDLEGGGHVMSISEAFFDQVSMRLILGPIEAYIYIHI